mgnify:CR=1 FL=1
MDDEKILPVLSIGFKHHREVETIVEVAKRLEALDKLKTDLSELAPRFVAVGHGFCMRLRGIVYMGQNYPSESHFVHIGQDFQPSLKPIR